MSWQSNGLPDAGDFGGTTLGDFDLAVGSVFAVRWFKVDRLARLRGVAFDHIWTPGENVATCRMAELNEPLEVCSTGDCACHDPVGFISPDHRSPDPECTCGFYAYAEGCDDGMFARFIHVFGVVECYGRTVVGTRGVKAEKAKVRALLSTEGKLRRNYPDVRFFRDLRDMVGAFDLVQPAGPTPETDPDFWTRDSE